MRFAGVNSAGLGLAEFQKNLIDHFSNKTNYPWCPSIIN